MNATTPAMRARAIQTWREDFERINASSKALIKPALVFLPAWWPSSNAAFVYFQTTFIGSGLVRAPQEVRAYVLAHELAHIRLRHTMGQVYYWLAALVAIGLSSAAPQRLAMIPMALVLASTAAWLFGGEERREFEADDEAAAMCGDAAVIKGLLWMEKRRSGGMAFTAKRIARRRSTPAVALQSTKGG
jgi:Zn-dependent protease with chaperone function